jgi:cardiolipin synthase (CMP-forming)
MKYIPNILTTIRFLLVFVYITVFYYNNTHPILYAMIIFLIAGLTDILDGTIARKFNLITKYGQTMDPLADKTMQLTVLTTLAFAGYIELWILYIILGKEAFMIISGMILYFSKTKIVIPSNAFGKITTVLIYLAIILSVFEIKGINIVFGLVISISMITLIQYIIIGVKKLVLSLSHK